MGLRVVEGGKVMTKNKERVELAQAEIDPSVRSPLDLLKYKQGASRQLREEGKPPPDSMLAVSADRATYTFILEDEVASIHFDRHRGEIFFRGHNIRNIDLSDGQLQALMHMEEVLKGDSRAKEHFPEYSATLARCLADK
jgi:hypothetical protein